MSEKILKQFVLVNIQKMTIHEVLEHFVEHNEGNVCIIRNKIVSYVDPNDLEYPYGFWYNKGFFDLESNDEMEIWDTFRKIRMYNSLGEPWL